MATRPDIWNSVAIAVARRRSATNQLFSAPYRPSSNGAA